MHFSDVEVGKQLIVGNGTYYDTLGLGRKAIRGSAYIEGPFLVGDAKSFGGVSATTMIARDVNEESNNPSRSLHVKGNTFLEGDGGTANGYNGRTGYIALDSNEKIIVKSKSVDIRATQTAKFFCENKLDIIGNAIMNINGGLVDMADGATSVLGSKTGPSSTEEKSKNLKA